jgi:hypothetical protein
LARREEVASALPLVGCALLCFQTFLRAKRVVTATALLDADCHSAPPTEDVSAMADYLLAAVEQPRPMATCAPTSMRDLLRRLALDVAAARLLVSEAGTT